MFFYNPESFDPTRYLPHELHRYADDARYFVHVLYGKRVFDKRAKDDWIPLKKVYLRRVMGSRTCDPVVQALIQAGVVEFKRHYIVGKESYKYRLREDLRHEYHCRYKVQDCRLIRQIEKVRSEEDRAKVRLDVHKHLYRYLRKLRIDVDQVRRNEPPQTHVLAEAIADKHFGFTPDKFGRVHTNLTNLKRELRQYLNYQGQELSHIDVRNSQPLMLSVLLFHCYLHDGRLQSLHSFSPLKDIFKNLNLPEPGRFSPASITLSPEGIKPLPPRPLRCARHLFITAPEDVWEYVSLCEKGLFYEELMKGLGIAEEDRNEFKKDFFARIFYCKNGYHTPESNYFRDRFPNVAQVVRELKAKDHSWLPTMLQRVEASVIINRIIRRMMNEYPNIFVSTIHDSVLTTTEHAGLVEGIMKEEFRRLWLEPTLRVDCLRTSMSA